MLALPHEPMTRTRVWAFCDGRQYLALKHEPTRDEVAAASEDITSWLASLKASGKPLPTPATAHPTKSVPSERPLRQTAGGKPAAANASDDGDDKPWSDAERAFAATREKQKGNEAFHAGELETAVKHYSRSLDLVPGSAVVLSNRCVAVAPVCVVLCCCLVALWLLVCCVCACWVIGLLL